MGKAVYIYLYNHKIVYDSSFAQYLGVFNTH